jgi:hypothetical protein
MGCSVSDFKKERTSFPLRLPKSLRDRARLLANKEGVSLNYFISQAVAEKASRLGATIVQEPSPSAKRKIDDMPPGLKIVTATTTTE